MIFVMRFLVDVLAARRITILVVEDKITEPIRTAVNDSDNEWLQYLVSCQKCVSVWAGLLIAFGLPKRLRYALALSEGTILVGGQLEAQQSRAFDRKAAALNGAIRQA